MQKSKIKCFLGGGESVQQSLTPFIVFLTLLFPSVSCHTDKCLGVLWNEAAWAHCFISVNIYRSAVSRVYFQSALAYKDERSLKGKGLNCLGLFCICENIFTVKSTSYFITGNVGLTCKGKVKAQTG
uniref:Secreted protein n=1 Tax=Pan paniscus TaxID=9597 RepID=A0A2R8ZB18_PANPA